MNNNPTKPFIHCWACSKVLFNWSACVSALLIAQASIRTGMLAAIAKISGTNSPACELMDNGNINPK